MRPVFFYVSCGVGMHYTHVYDMEDCSDEQISDAAYQLAAECAESIGEFVEVDDYYDMHGTDRDMDRVFCDEDLDYYWEEYDPVEHDCQRQGGGSFKEDIARW